MDEQPLVNGPDPEPQTGTAAEAFARLAARVEAMDARFDGRLAVIARALEHIAIEKQGIEVPDYNPTLAKINATLAEFAKHMKALSQSEALRMTPEEFQSRFEAAAVMARREDQAAIAELKRELADTRRDLRAAIGSVATIAQQERERWRWAGGGFVAGCLLWAALPGFVARIAPTDWHWPERLAARTVREPTLWEAGTRIMRAGNPEGWQAIVDAADMRRANQDTIAACETAAEKAKEPVRCTIRIGR